MNYNEMSTVKTNEGSGKKYFNPGIHEGVIISDVITHDKLETSKYTGPGIDFIFTGTNGEVFQHRVFPFVTNPTFKHFRGEKKDQLMTAEEQFNDYLANIKHIMTKALGEEVFAKALTKIVDFVSMGKVFKQAVDKYKFPFAIMFIANKGGYTTIPSWTGGFASYNANDLKWDENKYGKKKLTSATPVENPTASINYSASSATASDIDGLPF